MTGFLQKKDLTLASGSRARKTMLERAGLAVTVVVPDVDEDELRRRFQKEQAEAAEVAGGLASVKARSVSLKHDGFVIGGDQTMCTFDEQAVIFGKPGTPERLGKQLAFLSGQDCCLYSGAALAQKGRILWRSVAAAQIRYRSLTPEKIDAYIAAEPEAVNSAGGFLLERLGPRIIEDVQGDPFTILGLPLGDLLGALEHLDAIA